MSTIENRASISAKVNEEIIPMCSNGNKDAEIYLRKIFYVVRILDDLYDEDSPVDKKDITRVFFILGSELQQNTFYKKHCEMLTGMHIVGFNAWEDANEWEKGDDDAKRKHALIIKDFICELFSMVAFLTGGYNHMRKSSLITREFFLQFNIE